MSPSKPLRIIFAGTPEFAAQALAALLKTEHEIVAVYTQPDRPAGRGRKLTPSQVKVLAQEHGIEVRQPEKLKAEEDQAALRDLNADLMVVVAYGLLLPKAVLDAPRLGCINIHASLLPRWRGAAPIQRAIEAGDSETGVTIMQMDVGLDTGDMLSKHSTPIHADDTAQSLHDRLAVIGAEAVVDTIEALAQGQAKPEKQDDSLANYAHKMSKAEAVIDWQRPAIELDRLIRAFNPWPVAQTSLDDKVLRIWQASAIDDSGNTSDAAPGTIIALDKQGIDVATGSGLLRLLRVQQPGGKPLAIHELLNARHPLAVGLQLGAIR